MKRVLRTRWRILLPILLAILLTRISAVLMMRVLSGIRVSLDGRRARRRAITR